MRYLRVAKIANIAVNVNVNVNVIKKNKQKK